MITYDKIIIGAGIYGLYAANFSANKGEKVLVIEYDDEAFSRATYINQARVHNGYHYPRSYSTAIKSKNYFERFNKDFDFAVNNYFTKIYATSSKYSWTNAEQFRKFCENAAVKCEDVNINKYFKGNMVDGAFDTQEYAFDAMKIKEYFLEQLDNKSNVDIFYEVRIHDIKRNEKEKTYSLTTNKGEFSTKFLLNSTYASTNQITERLGFEKFKIKYEICEIILCSTSENLKDIGITVMDGPFFSVMPFGLNGLHSLTSVTFTPHITSYDDLPTFDCQKGVECSPKQLGNCNKCPNKPETAWNYMHVLAKKYLRDDINLKYEGSLFSIKPILMASEIDDSRPTVIRKFSENPTYASVLSGKVNTIYDLDEIL